MQVDRSAEPSGGCSGPVQERQPLRGRPQVLHEGRDGQELFQILLCQGAVKTIYISNRKKGTMFLVHMHTSSGKKKIRLEEQKGRRDSMSSGHELQKHSGALQF